jgi:hypothetical protein
MRRRLVWLAAWAVVLCPVPCLRAQDRHLRVHRSDGDSGG